MKTIKRMIASSLAWWLCVAVGVIALIWMAVAGAIGSRERAFQIAVAFDQLGNATGAGDEDETFSARCWRKRAEPKYDWLRRKIDAVFLFLIDEADHCRMAFEAEKSRRERPYQG